MKKIGIIGAVMALFIMLLVFMFASFGSGGSGSSGNLASPLVVFATEDEAYAYAYIGSEIGVPWDIVMLTDGICAYDAGATNLSACNPMLTSLQFCILIEDALTPVTQADASGNMTTEWVSQSTVCYTGLREILDYIGVNEDNLTYRDAVGIITAINQVADGKSTQDLKYTATLTVNPDYEDVLRNFVGLSEDKIRYVLDIYDTNYMVYLYGYTCVTDANLELPEIVQGSVTRLQLAEVAVSLLGHPYKMGGKYSQTGVPTGPLDCSGFVDWVYVQCFGKVVSSGRIPEGVAVSGTALQWYASEPISASELRVGDLGFLRDPASMRSGQINHVGIYIGTYDGNMYFVHCAGRAYGTPDSPTGRVGISCLDVSNSYNPVTDTTFAPAMRSCRFRYFRRPQFAFVGEEE